MDLISYFAVQHQIVIYHGKCWILSGFNCCLTCFYALIEHKKGSKFVPHFIADFNVMYQELEQNIPTVAYVFYHEQPAWIYVIMCNMLCSLTVFFKC